MSVLPKHDMPSGNGLRPMIEIADLWKSFGRVEVLKGVSLDVARGGVVAVIGPSGSGKSTLLRCINLLEEPDRGHIRVGEREMQFGRARRAASSDRDLAPSARRLAWCFSISTCSRI